MNLLDTIFMGDGEDWAYPHRSVSMGSGWSWGPVAACGGELASSTTIVYACAALHFRFVTSSTRDTSFHVSRTSTGHMLILGTGGDRSGGDDEDGGGKRLRRKDGGVD